MVARSSLNLKHRAEPLARAVALLAAVAVVASVLVAGDASALSPATGEAPAPFSPAVLNSAAALNATAEALVQAQPRQLASTAVTAGWGHAGGGHSCGLRTDATIACWGGGGLGEADPPGGTFSAVSAGYLHSCGLRTDATVACWGNNSSGQADPPNGTFSAVSAGVGYACGLRTDASIACWGANDSGRADPPSGTFGAVVAGVHQSCGLRTNGTVACWGADGSGVADAPSGTFSAVAVSGGQSCGLRTDATIICWGYYTDWPGQADALNGTFSAVSAGWGHLCGLRTDATVICWGENDFGQTDAPSGSFSAVAAGGKHSCGLTTSSTIICWGDNSAGQADPPDGQFGPLPQDTSTSPETEDTATEDTATEDTATEDTATEETRPANEGVPGVVRGLTATPVHGEGVEVRWSAPLDDGGSSIVHYEVEYSRGALTGHPVAGTTGARTIRRSVGGTSHFYEHLYSGVAYTVSVRAVNDAGSGSSATATFTIMRPCPAGDKFETKTESAWKLWKLGRRSTWIVALQDFVTIEGHTIEAGERGGKVSDESNLSQSGCSWIFEDAEVTGDARVSENAVVHGDARVYDNAQVYGSAEVFDDAKVYDNAQVYDNANVFGRAQVYGHARVYDHAIVHGRAKVYDTALVYERAQVFGEASVFLGSATPYDVNRFEHLGGRVYGEAKVYGQAKIHGYAELFGKAEFSGALEANDGEFDGEQEHVRAGQELYAEIFAHFARELTACDEDVGSYSSRDIPEIVRNLLSEDPLIRAISEIHVRNCQRLKIVQEVLNFFVPKLTWWDVAFAVALTVTGLRGSFYLKSLVELAQGTKPLLDLSKISDDIEQWEVDATRMFEEFKKCKDSWNSAESCEP